MKKIILTLLIFLAAQAALLSKETQDSINRSIYDKVIVSVDAGKEAGDLVADIAACLSGTPYVASTLEGGEEELKILLDKTDCMIFVESCICLALTAKGLRIVQGSTPLPDTPSYELYCRNIQNMRYRDGKVDGYASRLHYASEWMLQASRNGIMEEYTSKAGKTHAQHFSFMSSHAELYPALADSPEIVEKIRGAERMLEEAGPYSCISKEQLRDSGTAGMIGRGDIVAFVAGKEGLDITHLAIACPTEDGTMHFIHASSKAGKVIFESSSLADYTRTGVRLARLTL